MVRSGILKSSAIIALIISCLRKGHCVKKSLHRARAELIALIPPTLFFFIALHIVVLIRTLMLEGDGIRPRTSISIIIAALVLGKSVLVADLLPFINRYPHRPLVYNVLWKTTIYFLISMLVHYAELIIALWRKSGSLSFSVHELYARIVWPHFWALQLVLAVLIFMYCNMRELVRVIGPVKVWHIFFGRVPAFLESRYS